MLTDVIIAIFCAPAKRQNWWKTDFIDIHIYICILACITLYVDFCLYVTYVIENLYSRSVSILYWKMTLGFEQYTLTLYFAMS